jgi:topoisomerase IV subunit B
MTLKQKPTAVKSKRLKYDSDSIETLRFPDNVRANPSMYLGSVDAAGVWLTARELLDNFIDEAMAKRASKGWMHIDSDGSYWVLDDGQGVPQGIKSHTQHINGKDVTVKMPTMQAVFGELHTSGKKGSGAYDNSIGVHGIGSKGTNATSLFFEVWTRFQNKWYTIAFKKGKLVTKVTECRAPKGPDGKLVKSGTVIHFKPDPSIFTVKTFPPKMAAEWARIMSYFNPGVAIRLSNAKDDKTFLSKNGVVDYITARLKELKAEAEPKHFIHLGSVGDVVVAFSNYDGADVRGFTNGLNNINGGKHVDSVVGAVYAGLKPFIKTKRVDGKPVPVFRESDLKEGMVGIVNAKLSQAQFSSQDKAKLTDARVGADFEKELTTAATKFFAANKAMAIRLCERATKMNELKTQFTMSKKAANELNKLKRSGIPSSKYASYDLRTKVSDREVFLVEGDSAAGTVKKARFPFQSVLSLKGKILNVMKDMKGKALESDEVMYVLTALGYDAKAADPYAKLQVGKIICLADPDPDGPFVGETQIKIRRQDDGDLGMQPHNIEISKLVDKQFQVPVFVNGKEEWHEATASLVRNVDSIIALEIGKAKYKVDASHKWLCIKTDAMYGRDTVAFSDDLVYVQAKDLKIGDRVYMPQHNGKTKDKAVCDYATKLGFAPVSKMRVQQLGEHIPVYCLTVPKHHHFMLPSGIVSGNCHINSLLLTLFYKYLPELFERGMVYVSAAPEFYSIYKEQLVMADTLVAAQKKLKALGAPSSQMINHVKGYGELDAPLLRIMAMDPATRQIIRIKAIEHDDKVDFVRLMNDDVGYRRDMLGLPSTAKGDDEKPVRAAAKKVASKTATRKAPVKTIAARKIAKAPIKTSKKAPLRQAA